jgi:hypothetical protein
MMPIAINENKQKSEDYKDEDELQLIIFQKPFLLCHEDEETIYSIKRELVLPSAGNLDIFMIDSMGIPVAVEVKLARNSQSRREVVAQAFDYASDISQITIDELNLMVDSSIEDLLVNGELAEKKLWKTFAANLRSGILRIIIAIDEANENLVRIIRYLNDHSDLDVRLIEIKKYKNGEVLVPNIIVTGNSKIKDFPSASNSKSSNEFTKVIEEFSKLGLPYEVRKGNRNFRQVLIKDWPVEVHYEFLNNLGEPFSIDIHFEKASYKTFASKVLERVKTTKSGFELQLDQKWSNSHGRIRIFGDIDDAQGCAKKMQELIESTKAIIDELVNEKWN